MNRQIFVPITDWEDSYYISNFGNVYSVKSKKLLKPTENSQGYFRVLLQDKGKKKKFFVHRLVAEHFVLKDDAMKTIVNHLDCNIHNNKYDNLEWTTMKGNYEHSQKLGRYERTTEWLKNLRRYKEKVGKSVIATNIATKEQIRFICLNDCKNQGFEPSCVCECCKGKRKTHKGYEFKYE